MSSTATVMPTVGARSSWGRDVALSASVVMTGVGFNLLRLLIRLDTGPLSESIAAFVGFGGAALLLAGLARLDRKALGLRPPAVVPLQVGSTMAAAALIGVGFATAPVTRTPMPAQLVAGFVLFALCTAPAEELMFRGVLWGIVHRTAGPTAATVVSSLAFALAHLPAYGVVSLPLALTAGLILGWLRWWSRSLLGPCLVHAAADMALLWL